MKNWLSDLGAKYDVIDAVMVAGFSDLLLTKKRAELLMSEMEHNKEQFKLNVEAFNRVCNLAAKAEHKAVYESLFAHESEKALYQAWQSIHENFETSIAARSLNEAYSLLATLQAPIVSYFDSVMVMDKDENVKANRLATLACIADDIALIADLSKLVW